MSGDAQARDGDPVSASAGSHDAAIPSTLRDAMEHALAATGHRAGGVSVAPDAASGAAQDAHSSATPDVPSGAASDPLPGATPDALSRAALHALRAALELRDDRAAALPLLAADALVTAAFENAAAADVRTLAEALHPANLALLLEDGAELLSESRAVLDALHAARLEEKRQALFYRSLASQAEDAGDADLAERLNGLHADEQHHLSRLTVRLVESGESVADLGAEPVPSAAIDGWETQARERERAEIARYDALLAMDLDERTREMLREFAVAEQQHERQLGGKWMGAQEGLGEG